MKRKQKTKQGKRIVLFGFSIGEVLISVTVLVVGILAAIALISESLQQSMRNRDLITAASLAQEAIELYRNARDGNMAAGHDPELSMCLVFDDATCNTNIDAYCKESLSDLNWGAGTTPLTGCDNNFNSDDDVCYLGQQTAGQPVNFYVCKTVAAAPQTKFRRVTHVEFDKDTKIADVSVFSYWGANRPPLDGTNKPDPAKCVAANKCVFAKARFAPWGR